MANIERATQSGTRRRLIVVDGASLLSTLKDVFGFRRIKFKGLYTVLTEQVGTCRICAAPVITLRHNLWGLEKELAGAGFKALKSRTAGGEDDDLVKSIISRADPEKVGELVLVSSDKDYIPDLLCAVQNGIRVFWVSTMKTRSGKCRVSEDVKQLCEDGTFSFFDLHKCCRTIGEDQGFVSPHHDIDCCNRTVVQLTLVSRNQREHLELMGEIARLEQRFGRQLKKEVLV